MNRNEAPVPQPELSSLSPDELAVLIDSLMASGTQHINLTAGGKTEVQTVNSTEFCKGGACSVPTLGKDEEDGF